MNIERIDYVTEKDKLDLYLHKLRIGYAAMMKKVHSQTCLELILLGLLSALVFLKQIDSIGKINGLNAYDPWYYLHLTKGIIQSGKFSWTIENAVFKTPITYLTLTHLLSAIVSITLKVDPFIIYKFGGPFLLLLVNLGLYILIRKITSSPIISLVGCLIFSSMPYVLYRMLMNVPENYALFFALILVFILYKNFKLVYALIPLIGSLFYHLKSFFIPIGMIILYLLLYKHRIAFKISLREIRATIFIVTICVLIILVLICLPVIREIRNYVLFLVAEHMGKNPEWKQVDPSPAAYKQLHSSDYVRLIGLVPIVLSILGSVYVVFRKGEARKHSFLMIWLLLAFLGTRSISLGLYVPPHRFLTWFAIPAVLVAAIFLRVVLTNVSLFKGIKVAGILVLVMLSIQTMMTARGWSGITTDDIRTIQKIKLDFPHAIFVGYGAPYNSFDIPNSEFAVVYQTALFSMTSESELFDFLRARYGRNKQIIAGISTTGYELVKMRNPLFFKVFNKYKVYQKNLAILYEFKI